VQLAVDDFGTGFSDFRRLGDLPFDILKLDTAFVWTMLHAQETRKAATSLIRLANRLGLTTVAEGVEEQAQADLLIYLGCECGQGWLYGKPNCWPEVWKTLKTWNPIPASPSRALLPAYDGNALSVLNLCAPGGPFLPEDNAALGNSTKIKCV
jgi:EAL domain-containing protein (putative c-di-GMP-specific phosphodiesterase class I)